MVAYIHSESLSHHCTSHNLMIGTQALGTYLMLIGNTCESFTLLIGYRSLTLSPLQTCKPIIATQETRILALINLPSTLCVKDEHTNYTITKPYGLPRIERVSKIKDQ